MVIENLDIKKQFYKSLNERQRRQYCGQIALDLGHGGIKLVCEIFNLDPVTLRTGIRELKEQENLSQGRVRKEGGGRKKNF
jgi:hypothetical protein